MYFRMSVNFNYGSITKKMHNNNFASVMASLNLIMNVATSGHTGHVTVYSYWCL